MQTRLAVLQHSGGACKLDAPPRRESSLVVYRGPSRFDGGPIVAILTGLLSASRNSKTGPQCQLHITREDVAPHVAQRSGADYSVCGSCPLRPKLASKGEPRCYVKTWQGTNSAHKYSSHKPVRLAQALEQLRGKSLRLGSYGEPYALPESLITQLTEASSGWTGYTHAWQRPDAQWLRNTCMASCETELEAWQAWGMGWRTFRTTPRDGARGALARLETLCPHVSSGGNVQCIDCGLCSGAGPQRSITIPVHN